MVCADGGGQSKPQGIPFIMWIIVRLLCVLALSEGVRANQKVLNYSLLNEGETVSISLATYLDAPKEAVLDRVHSTPHIETLLAMDTTTNQPLLNVSSVPMQVKLPNGTDYSFASSDVLESCSLYNQPNKLFLLPDNLIISVRYQFSPSDAPFSISATVIEGNESCTELNVLESHGKYYAVVGCLRSETESVLHGFLFNATDPSTVNGLIPLNSLPLKIANCLRLESYSILEFLLNAKTYYNSVLFYCAEGVKQGQPSNLYIASIKNTADVLVAVEPTYPLSTRVLLDCLSSSEWVGRYEQGLLTLRLDKLFYFHGQTCQQILDVTGAQFVEQVEEEGVQYVYVMFADKMVIKESYSPNYQTVPLHPVNNLTLHSYAIARRFLTLLFDNSTHQVLRVYDLVRASYPTEIDTLSWPKTKANITAYPVANFLDGGNYFLTFDQLTGQLVLNYYQGYLFSFYVRDPTAPLTSHIIINITNQQNQNLVVDCTIRGFNDSSLAEAPNSHRLKTYRELLSLNLSDFVQGPLARFYNYPNGIAAFQYINQYSEMDLAPFLKANGRPLAISFNNYLNAAVINFYHSALARTCELEFLVDTQSVQLSDCKTLTRRKSQLEIPNEIVVLSEDKYLQYNGSVLEYCALSTNNEFECVNITGYLGMAAGGIDKVKLVRYFSTKDTDEVVELLVHNSKEVLFCCLQRNVFNRSAFNSTLHFHANSTTLPDLASWSIRKLLFDPAYAQFLVLHLANGTAHRVVAFTKPAPVKNSTSFIGHVMRQLQFSELEGVFNVGNLLVCVSPAGGGWLVQEYKITKYFRVKETRRYPLYELAIVPGGAHTQDGDFIYLDAKDGARRVFAVYSPLKESFGVLSHKFGREGEVGLVLAQQLGEVSGNSMGLNGGRLFGLVPPEMILKFLGSSSARPKMGMYEFQVSAVDNSGAMKLLSFQFEYNQGGESIRYDGPPDFHLRFAEGEEQAEFQIDPEKVHGPVNDYQLQLPTDNSCSFFSVEARDVFTKEGCLAYSKPTQFGALTDFLALQQDGYALELLVTELSLICVLNRRMALASRIDLPGRANCKFEQGQDVLMVCDSTTSIGKLVDRVAVGTGGLGCTLAMEAVALPGWFGYADFALKVSGEWLLMEVPIRYKQNCIYYKTTIVDGRISDTHSLLVGPPPSQLIEFETVDTSIAPELFFILDRGIGIYNLNDTAPQIMPALWLSQTEISLVSIDEGPLVYLKFLSLARAGDYLNITLQVGTEGSAFEVMIEVVQAGTAIAGQTNYTKLQVRTLYQYRQYTSCRNGQRSKGQAFGSLTIKMCSYEPPDELVFANFVSIANDTPRALIQFYNRSGHASYPFRTDTIYANALSHHAFLIRNNTLIVASLFNLLCYYALANSLRWQLHYLETSNLAETDLSHTDKYCVGTLVISNLEYRKELQVLVTYDYDADEEDYWSNPIFYIQRIPIFLLLANGVRLLWKARSKRTTKLRKRFSTRIHTNRFEVMVKINSKITH